MKIDLHCPVEVRKWDIAVFDRGLPRAYIHLFNLSHLPILSLEGQAHWSNAAGEEIEALPFSLEASRAYARSEFTIALSPSQPECSAVELVFTRIRFAANRQDWLAQEGAWIEVPPPAPIGGQEEAALVRLAGAGATQYARLIPGAWICVCGRANALDAEQCARCMRGREVCLTRFTREAARYHLPPLPSSILASPPEPELPFPARSPSASKSTRKSKMRGFNRRFWFTVALLVLALLLGLLASGAGNPSAPQPAVPTQRTAVLSIAEIFKSASSASAATPKSQDSP